MTNKLETLVTCWTARITNNVLTESLEGAADVAKVLSNILQAMSLIQFQRDLEITYYVGADGRISVKGTSEPIVNELLEQLAERVDDDLHPWFVMIKD